MKSDKRDFVRALKENSVEGMQLIPKSDLHCHGRRSGNVSYIEKHAGVKINNPPERFSSLAHMQEWFTQEIYPYANGVEGSLKRLEGAFVQAKVDSIKVLSMSFSLGAVRTLGGIEKFIKSMNHLSSTFAPDTVFLPELALDKACDVEAIYPQLEEILAYDYFRSMDVCNNELAQSVGNFKKLFRYAKSKGLLLRAHVGEYGTADDVMEAVEELELDEVHHGIAAAESKQIMRWLEKNKIRLNVCPTSNVMLGRVKSYSTHPIRELFHAGVPVTINTDDMLIFNQSVTQEFMNLYKSGVFNEEDLNIIRLTGLEALSNKIKTVVK